MCVCLCVWICTRDLIMVKNSRLRVFCGWRVKYDIKCVVTDSVRFTVLRMKCKNDSGFGYIIAYWCVFNETINVTIDGMSALILFVWSPCPAWFFWPLQSWMSQRCFSPWTIFENTGLNLLLWTSVVSCLHFQIGCSAVVFRVLWLVVLVRFVAVD